MAHNFYKIPSSVSEQLKILKDAIKSSYEVSIEELKNSSAARVKSKKTLEEIISIYKESKFKHFVFIHRKEVPPFSKNDPTEYIETGFSCSDEDKQYFIFVYVDISMIDYFVDKFKLRLM